MSGNDNTGEEVVIQFEDFTISNADWYDFQASASEDDLLVLAIGSRFRTSGKKFFVRSLISVLGTILTILAVVFAGNMFASFLGIVLLVAGYFFFNGMAVKLVSYTSTYDDCYKRLSSTNQKALDILLGKENGFVIVFKSLVQYVLFLFTIPFRAILMLISMVLPQAQDWCIAHGAFGGTVVTLPQGYEMDRLKEVGEYYKSCSFLDAWEENIKEQKRESLSKMKEYTYKDEMGVVQTAYSDDGENFYSTVDKEYKVGESTDGGKKIDLSKK